MSGNGVKAGRQDEGEQTRKQAKTSSQAEKPTDPQRARTDDSQADKRVIELGSAVGASLSSVVVPQNERGLASRQDSPKAPCACPGAL
jgi:hypothetical protein